MSQPLSAADPALVSVLARALQDKQREVDELQERLRIVEGHPRDEPMPEAAPEGVDAPLLEPEELRRSPTQPAFPTVGPLLAGARARSYDLLQFADYLHHNYFGLDCHGFRNDYGGLPPLAVTSVRPPPYAYAFHFKADYPESVPELEAESVSEGSVGDAADE
ncbi:hypothetical protein MIND_00191400 [Mycena indigotica]|uniref:Uncharacterized protein n=1 Tax=Mycena indigotica TaxID=2126181 RepID=A0A8H6T6Q8_9AGAR|nr:uncharacterized protein MIND_00191400 [Mycena indigotica]KAF7311809.1 hypothetical protein MIND_00191400 [Mycena indigotica]